MVTFCFPKQLVHLRNAFFFKIGLERQNGQRQARTGERRHQQEQSCPSLFEESGPTEHQRTEKNENLFNAKSRRSQTSTLGREITLVSLCRQTR